MTDAHDLHQRLALTLHKASGLVDRVADSYLRSAHDMGISVFATMVVIDAVGPARQSVVAQALGVSRAAVTQRLAELVDRRLVDVSADPENRGARLVRLSRTGRRTLAQAWDGLAAFDDGIEDGVDLVALLTQLDLLVANAERYLATRSAGR